MAEASFLYVIGDGTGAHKVGVSARPARRLGQLQVGNPRLLSLLHSRAVEGRIADAVEEYAHWLLRESYLRGEWFEVTDEAAWVALIAAEEAVLSGLSVPRPVTAGRCAAVSIRVEQVVKAALERAAKADDRTVAQYVERLIIADLRAKGLLKDDQP